VPNPGQANCPKRKIEQSEQKSDIEPRNGKEVHEAHVAKSRELFFAQAFSVADQKCGGQRT
jgi:hypothetical protein